jgi:hypothetical protein
MSIESVRYFSVISDCYACLKYELRLRLYETVHLSNFALPFPCLKYELRLRLYQTVRLPNFRLFSFAEVWFASFHASMRWHIFVSMIIHHYLLIYLCLWLIVLLFLPFTISLVLSLPHFFNSISSNFNCPARAYNQRLPNCEFLPISRAKPEIIILPISLTKQLEVRYWAWVTRHLPFPQYFNIGHAELLNPVH